MVLPDQSAAAEVVLPHPPPGYAPGHVVARRQRIPVYAGPAWRV